MIRKQRSCSVADNDLRQDLIADIRRQLIPEYGRFLDRFRDADVTKNTAKYIRYDVSSLEAALKLLFDGTGS
jgi:hypothetical protein